MSDEQENMNQHSPSPHEGEDGEESFALESGRPSVATAPGKIMVFVIFAVVCVAIVVKSIFFSSGGAPENKVKTRPERVAAASTIKPSQITPGELPAPPQPEPVGSYSSPTSPSTSTSSPSSSAPALSPLSAPAFPAAPGKPVMGSGISAPAVVGASPQIVPPTFTAPVVSSVSAPPPPPPGLTPPALPEVRTSMPKDEKEVARLKTESTVYGGGGKGPSSEKNKTATAGSGFSGSDANSQFAQNAITANRATVAEAERIEDLDSTIIQGKIINGVLETAINSDLPGSIRAVVSHDTYAEAGRAILIPKGSRLIGTYNAAVKRGQARVFIIWSRVIRPDGVTIDVNSPGVDGLGRAGLDGDVDNKYVEMFSNALLTSSLDIGLAAIGQGLFGDNQSTTTTNGSGGTTTSSSATAQSMQEAVQTIGSVGKSIVNNTLNLAPTITVDQGAPVNIFVNRELTFPASVVGRQYFIQ